MPTVLSRIKESAEVSVAASKSVVQRMCQVSLASDWRAGAKEETRVVKLNWCAGLRQPNTVQMLRPGKTLVLPLDKCRSWFGPFDMFRIYESECMRNPRDERVISEMEQLIAGESARYLTRYDYPYDGRGRSPDMTPIGPHRSPDVTITIINEDGENDAPIRLYEQYGIGEYDESEFKTRETEQQIRERFQSELRSKDEAIQRLSEKQSELAGLLKGFVAGQASKPSESKPAAHASA